MDAPITAAIVRAALAVMDTPSATGTRLAAWPGSALDDALGLRFAGGVRALWLAGQAPTLDPVYDGSLSDQPAIDDRVGAVVAAHDAAVAAWLDHPPQTNEAGRSASIIAGLMWLGQTVPPRFTLTEIGSSAGLNLLLGRHGYRLGDRAVGPEDARVVIAPRWEGPAPDGPAPGIERVTGSDIAPLDSADPATASRLRAYVWPEAPDRLARLDAGLAMAREAGLRPVRMDAADAVDAMLAEPHQPGVTRVLFHTIVWQYLLPATQARIHAAMEAAGAAARPDAPLAWLALETDRATIRHRLVARLWDGSGSADASPKRQGAPVALGEAHAHGAWVRWLGAPPA